MYAVCIYIHAHTSFSRNAECRFSSSGSTGWSLCVQACACPCVRVSGCVYVCVWCVRLYVHVSLSGKTREARTVLDTMSYRRMMCACVCVCVCVCSILFYLEVDPPFPLSRRPPKHRSCTQWATKSL